MEICYVIRAKLMNRTRWFSVLADNDQEAIKKFNIAYPTIEVIYIRQSRLLR